MYLNHIERLSIYHKIRMKFQFTWKAVALFVVIAFMMTTDEPKSLSRNESVVVVSAFTTIVVRSQLRNVAAVISTNRCLGKIASSDTITTSSTTLYNIKRTSSHKNDGDGNTNGDWRRWCTGTALGCMMILSTSSNNLPTFPFMKSIAYADTTATTTTTTTTTTVKNYDGFADYAKENQMEKSDVACFINQCGPQTKELFRNPRGIKGIVCLGKCKGEQSCATRCFAQYSSPALNEWLSCTIEEEGCVKVPQKIDNSAEQLGYPTVVQKFDPSTLVGTWYKTDGLNPNYDLFDCQTNTFRPTATSTTDGNKIKEFDMDIFFRVQRPVENGGGYWENQLTEHMILDNALTVPTSLTDTTSIGDSTPSTTLDDSNDMDATGRTMHTSGKMYGLSFYENWYILGESDGRSNPDIPPFKLVAYKGHTLQGNYEGAFVYAKEPILPAAAVPAVQAAAQRAGLNFDDFTRIDNTCPTVESPLNDELAGTGTTTMDWVQLITGEGGVIDWISPGWRGEYNSKNK